MVPVFARISGGSSNVGIFFLVPAEETSARLIYVCSTAMSVLLAAKVPSVGSFSSNSQSTDAVPAVSGSLGAFYSAHLGVRSVSSLIRAEDVFVFR